MRLGLFKKKKYHCIHCWRGYDRKQLCPYCHTPVYTIDDIMRAAIKQLEESEGAIIKFN